MSAPTEKRQTHLRLVSTRMRKPRTYTSAEEVLDAVRERIFMDGRPYRVIAAATGVSTSTVTNIAYSVTQWPRPKTLFPLMKTLGLKMKVYYGDE